MDRSELDWLAEFCKRADATEIEQSDSLDVKANIWLVVITFLAGVDAGLLLRPRGDAAFRVLELAAIALVTIAGVLVIIALRPTNYAFPMYPEEARRLLADADEFYGPGGPALNYVKTEDVELTMRRVRQNRGNNARKSKWLVRVYWLVICALFANLASLIWIFLRLKPLYRAGGGLGALPHLVIFRRRGGHPCPALWAVEASLAASALPVPCRNCTPAIADGLGRLQWSKRELMAKVAKTGDRAKAAEAAEQACPKCGKPVRVVKRVRSRELNISGGMYLSCSVCEFAEKL